MTSAARWGALVVASLPCLPVACSPAPAPVAPVQPVASASVVASAPKPPPAPRLTGLVDLFTAVSDPSTPEPGSGSVDVATARFGRGTFTHRGFRSQGHRGNPCPVTRAEGCGTFALRLDASAAPTGDLWPAGGTSERPAPIASDDRAAKVFPSPHAWVAFAGGRDALYALREGGRTIDRIDAQGVSTLFVEDGAMTGWSDLWVIELHGRVLVAGLGEAPRQGQPSVEEGGPLPSWRLAEVIAGAPGTSRHLGPVTELPMRTMDRFDAHGARSASQDGKMAALRLPELMALPDDGADKDRWAMVWLEVVAPPYNWPHGKLQKGVSARPRATGTAAASGAKKGARHDCGGPASRNVDDASVTKRAHVTRFAGARMLDDQVQWTGASVGLVAEVKLAPRLDGDQVIVAMPTKTRAPSGKESELRGRGDDDEEIKLPHDERVTAFAYDPGAREGIVVMHDQGRTLYRRFDAAGKPLGDAVEADAKVNGIGDISLVDGKWMVIAGWPHALYNLSDRTGPFPLHEAIVQRNDSRLVGLTGGGGVIMHIESPHTLFSTPVGPGGVLGPAVKLEELPDTFSTSRFQVLVIDKAPSLFFFESARDASDTGKMAWRPIAPGAAWQRTELPRGTTDNEYLFRFRQLHGDAVLRTQVDERHTSFVWLKSGQATVREAPREQASSWRDGDEETGTGPLLGHGLRLPNEPGALVQDDVTEGLDASCEGSVATGPDTVVVVCVHPTDPVVPSLRVALRTLRIEPAR